MCAKCAEYDFEQVVEFQNEVVGICRLVRMNLANDLLGVFFFVSKIVVIHCLRERSKKYSLSALIYVVKLLSR